MQTESVHSSGVSPSAYSGADWTTMAGTEGTGQYVVIAKTSRGRLGIRTLSDHSKCEHCEGAGSFYRIRVEPKKAPGDKMRSHFGSGWKTYGDGDQPRFSFVATTEVRDTAIKIALQALGVAEGLKTVVNAAAPDWAKALVESVAKSDA